MHSYTKRILLLLVISGLCLFLYYARKTQGTAIILTGTSSSGKSSVYRELQHQLTPAEYRFFNQDDFEDSEVARKGTSLSPEERKLIDRQFFQAITETLALGKNAVVDAVLQIPANPYDPKYANHPARPLLKHAITVLFYCPLDEVIERTKVRNRSTIAAEQREAYFAFRQFLGFYKLQETAGEQVVDVLATAPLKKVLHDTIEDLLTRLPPEEASEAPSIQQFEHKFIQHYQLDARTEITIVPVYHYDLVINTSLHTTQEIVAQVKAFFSLLQARKNQSTH